MREMQNIPALKRHHKTQYSPVLLHFTCRGTECELKTRRRFFFLRSFISFFKQATFPQLQLNFYLLLKGNTNRAAGRSRAAFPLHSTCCFICAQKCIQKHKVHQWERSAWLPFFHHLIDFWCFVLKKKWRCSLCIVPPQSMQVRVSPP